MARGSASIRRTSFSRMTGSESRPFSASESKRWSGRLVDANHATTRRVRGPSGFHLRAADLPLADVRVIHVRLVARDDPAPLQSLGQAFRLPELPDERRSSDVRTGFLRDANLKPGVSA